MKSIQVFPARRLLMALFFSALSVIGASAQDSTKYFMKVSNVGEDLNAIIGSSVVVGYEQQIPIQGFSMETFKAGEAQPGSFFSVQMLLDPKAMPFLFKDVLTAPLRTIRITGVAEGVTAGSFEKVIELEIEGVFESLNQEGVAGDDLFHSLDLQLSKIRMTTYWLRPDGTVRNEIIFGWDFAAGAELPK